MYLKRFFQQQKTPVAEAIGIFVSVIADHFDGRPLEMVVEESLWQKLRAEIVDAQLAVETRVSTCSSSSLQELSAILIETEAGQVRIIREGDGRRA